MKTNLIKFSLIFFCLGIWTGLIYPQLNLLQTLALLFGLIVASCLLNLSSFSIKNTAFFYFIGAFLGWTASSSVSNLEWRDWHSCEIHFRSCHMQYQSELQSKTTIQPQIDHKTAAKGNTFNSLNLRKKYSNSSSTVCKSRLKGQIIQAFDQWNEPIPDLKGRYIYLTVTSKFDSPLVRAKALGKLKISATRKIKFKPFSITPLSSKGLDFFKQRQLHLSLYWQKSILNAADQVKSYSPSNRSSLTKSMSSSSFSWGRSLILAMLGVQKTNQKVDYVLRRLGLNHLTAISGLHFSLVAILGSVLMIARAVPIQMISAATFSTLFLLVNDLNGSSTRAWIMSLIAIGCVLQARVYVAMHALALATLILLLIYPSWACAPGFILSVSCTALLIAFSPILKPLVPRTSDNYRFKLSQWMEPLFNLLALQAALICFSSLFQLYWFGSISWLSIPANLFLAPLLGVIFYLSLIAAIFSLFSASLASFFLKPLFYICDQLLKALSHLPHRLDARWSVEIDPIFLSFALPILIVLLIILLRHQTMPSVITNPSDQKPEEDIALM
jgi:ComEC/Rec2-related protein